MNHLKPRNVVVGARRTTVRLENRYWEELQNISRRTGRSIRDICTTLDSARTGTLASALRLFVLDNLEWSDQDRNTTIVKRKEEPSWRSTASKPPY